MRIKLFKIIPRYSPLFWVIALLGLTSCTLKHPGPLQTPPPPSSADIQPQMNSVRPFPQAWWTTFNDPELTRLINLARTNNLDLAQAAARIDAARARAKIAGADASVQVMGSVDALRQRTSENTALQTGRNYASQFGGDLTFSYELDIWGRVKAFRNAAEKEIVLSSAERAAAEISLLTLVAKNYLNALALRREIAVIDNQLAQYAETEHLQTVRVEAGFATELDLQRTRIERATAEGEREYVQQREQAYQNALALLCGLTADSAKTNVPQPQAIMTLPPAPQTLALALLEARPDVAARRTAWEVAAQRLHVAQAERLPALKLAGSIGYASQYPEDLLNWKSHLWSLTAGLTAPLLDGGRLRGNLDLANAQLREAASAYEAAMLTAYREVADARINVISLADQQHAALRVCSASQRALALAQERYEKGYSSYLDVVESNRSLLAAQRTRVRLAGEQQCAFVDLVRALGLAAE